MGDIERMIVQPQGRAGLFGTSRLRRSLAGDTGPWVGAIGGLWLAGGGATAAGILGAPTGFGTAIDIVSAVAAHTAAFALCAMLIAWALTFLPRLSGPFGTIGGLLYTAAWVFFLLFFSDMGVAVSLIIAVIYALAMAAGGWLLAAAVAGGTSPGRRTAAVLALALLCGAATWAANPTISLPAMRHASHDDADAAFQGDAGAGGAAPLRALTTGDPSQPGAYAYTSFTYGSGTDRHRAEFGSQVRLTSKPVDASAYLKSWPMLRKWFWGFGPKSLPLNGRVWMPEGDGPYPLVLIVHGNHAMEDYSDGGYAYLGEQLASRGFIAVSIDENFLNFSTWSGIPKADMKLRAWVLLQHIGQLRNFAQDAMSPVYAKVDFHKISLVGHSRGGQAVAMAADRDAWFADDGTLPARDSYRIVSVAAIAPTDTVVDGKQAALRNISYLVLQGASDADINDFYGDRQYLRTTFAGSGGASFKASLYIEGANHGQFNASWGARDNSLPAGLFLREPALGEEAQQRIAKLYLTAFMEATLLGDGEYAPLFEDYRAARAYLPDTRYVNRYESAGFQAIARFDEAGSNAAHPAAGLSGAAQGIDASVEEARDRQRQGKGTNGLALQWTRAGEYTMTFARPMTAASAGDEAALSFAMADLSRDLPGWDGRTAAAADNRVGLADANGNYAEVPLADFAAPQPLFRADILRLGRLAFLVDHGKYKERYEPVFQTYRLPLRAWTQANPAFDAGAIARMTFVAGRRGPGKVMLDDIGIAPE